MENYVIESKNERLNRRILKFRRDWEHYQYLIKKGLHPLDITDRLIHIMFHSLQVGLENKYPNASPKEIHAKMKILLEKDLKLKKLRRRRPNGRN